MDVRTILKRQCQCIRTNAIINIVCVLKGCLFVIILNLAIDKLNLQRYVTIILSTGGKNYSDVLWCNKMNTSEYNL